MNEHAPQNAGGGRRPGNELETPEPGRYEGARKAVGDMARASLAEQAQLTMTASADAGQIRELLADWNRRPDLPPLRLLDLVAWTCAQALKFSPLVNSRHDRENGHVVHYVLPNLGIAVDTEFGLKTPVIRYAHRLSLSRLSEQIRECETNCRDDPLPPGPRQDGRFTIYRFDQHAVDSSTPINIPPQSACLGYSGLPDPVPAASRVVLSLTINLRVVPGGEGARFLREIAQNLENVKTALVARGGERSRFS